MLHWMQEMQAHSGPALLRSSHLCSTTTLLSFVVVALKRKFSPRKHGLFTKRCCSEQIQHQLTGNDKKCSGKGSQPVAPLPPFEKNLCKSVCYCLCLPGCLPAHLPDCSPTCLSTGPRYAASTCNRDPTGQSGSYSSRRKPRFWGCPGGHLGLFLAS